MLSFRISDYALTHSHTEAAITAGRHYSLLLISGWVKEGSFLYDCTVILCVFSTYTFCVEKRKVSKRKL